MPRSIRSAIDDWRVWITVSVVAGLLVNETVTGMMDGQPIIAALTRLPFYKVPYLILVCGIIAQAVIGAIPFAAGVFMTLYDAVLKRREQWRKEAREEAREEASRAREEAQQQAQQQAEQAQQAQQETAQALAELRRIGEERGEARGREELLRKQITAVLTDDTLTPDEKNRFMAILTAVTTD